MFDSDILAQRGFIVAPGLIGPAECRALAALWPDQQRFRKHIVMQRHGYGQGDYATHSAQPNGGAERETTRACCR